MKKSLEKIYKSFNRREYVHPDPLEFLYAYKDLKDREIVGIIAASLAYGRVAQILKSVSNALARMKSSPHEFIAKSSEKEIRKAFAGFKHRFTTGSDLAELLCGAKGAIEDHGSLGKCFFSGYAKADETILPALSKFAKKITRSRQTGLFPSPEMGSACKRPNLFLRWMVRKDSVDPGGWDKILASKLVIPLDTHMHKISRMFKFTERKMADIKTAVEITCAFSKISPEDPAKYDFSLTRFGIRGDMDIRELRGI